MKLCFKQISSEASFSELKPSGFAYNTKCTSAYPEQCKTNYWRVTTSNGNKFLDDDSFTIKCGEFDILF